MTEQEKKEHVNHFLTLFIRECYHDEHSIYEYRGSGYDYNQCSICGKMWLINDPIPNPDFYTPNDFDRLRKWIEKNQEELWEEYIGHIIIVNRDNPKGGATVNAILNPTNLYEFLKEHREEWEWVFCFDGCMKCKDDTRCNYEGKIQHPAAKYLNSLKEE